MFSPKKPGERPVEYKVLAEADRNQRYLLVACYQWQLLQLELEQEEQPDEPEEGVKLPSLLKEHVDIRRSNFSPLQFGHKTLSSPRKTRASK